MSYTFLPQNDILISFSPNVQYRRVYDFSQTLTDEEYSVGMFMSGWRQTTLWFNFQTGLERYEGRNFRGSEFRCHLDSEPLSWLQAGLSFELGDGSYYSEDPYQGWKRDLGLQVTLRPLTNLRLALNLQNNVFYKERGGEKEYDIVIASLRTSYQLSKPLSLRFIADYNDYYDKQYLSFLFSYEYRPGTVFYFGLDSNRGLDDEGVMQRSKYVFLKFSYWWRSSRSRGRCQASCICLAACRPCSSSPCGSASRGTRARGLRSSGGSRPSCFSTLSSPSSPGGEEPSSTGRRSPPATRRRRSCSRSRSSPPSNPERRVWLFSSVSSSRSRSSSACSLSGRARPGYGFPPRSLP